MSILIGFAVLALLVLLVVLSGLAAFRRPHPVTALFTLFALAFFTWQAVTSYRDNRRLRQEMADYRYPLHSTGPSGDYRRLEDTEAISGAWWKIMTVAGFVPLAGLSAQVLKWARARGRRRRQSHIGS